MAFGSLHALDMSPDMGEVPAWDGVTCGPAGPPETLIIANPSAAPPTLGLALNLLYAFPSPADDAVADEWATDP
jgi:hypothetical protein